MAATLIPFFFFSFLPLCMSLFLPTFAGQIQLVELMEWRVTYVGFRSPGYRKLARPLATHRKKEEFNRQLVRDCLLRLLLMVTGERKSLKLRSNYDV
jgi:hypothetical protein